MGSPVDIDVDKLKLEYEKMKDENIRLKREIAELKKEVINFIQIISYKQPNKNRIDKLYTIFNIFLLISFHYFYKNLRLIYIYL